MKNNFVDENIICMIEGSILMIFFFRLLESEISQLDTHLRWKPFFVRKTRAITRIAKSLKSLPDRRGYNKQSTTAP